MGGDLNVDFFQLGKRSQVLFRFQVASRTMKGERKVGVSVWDRRAGAMRSYFAWHRMQSLLRFLQNGNTQFRMDNSYIPDYNDLRSTNEKSSRTVWESVDTVFPLTA